MKYLFLLTFFSFAQVTASENKRKIILVSLPPYQTLVQRIGGDLFDVTAVVPLESNPHTYEPTTKQLKILERGSVWFCIGEPFERKLLPWIQEKNPTIHITDLRQPVALLSGSCCHHEEEDRHLWLSPKVILSQIDLITDTLSKMFPENKATFIENGTLLKEELSQLDKKIHIRLQPKAGASILVSHPAFAYFCKDYGLKQLSIEHEGKEATLHHLTALMEKAKHNKPCVALSMPQHSGKGLEVVAQKLHIPVTVIDPYGLDPLHTMQQLTELIAGEKNQ